MSFLVCSFLSLILSSFRHHHVFSKVRKHCFGLFQKRSQMLHSTHEGPLAQIWSPARKRMNDRKKKKRETDTLGTSRFIPQSSIGGGKGGSDFLLFFFFWQLLSLLINATSFDQHKETGSTPQHPSPLQTNLTVGLPVWLQKALPDDRVAVGPPASLSKFAERGGGAEFKHQLRPA